jgi:hypothetical protein
MHQQEIAELDKEYAADLPGFEAFVKTDAYQHMLKATSAALQTFYSDGNKQLNSSTSPVADTMRAFTQSHESEWQAFYKAQRASH